MPSPPLPHIQERRSFSQAVENYWEALPPGPLHTLRADKAVAGQVDTEPAWCWGADVCHMVWALQGVEVRIPASTHGCEHISFSVY